MAKQGKSTVVPRLRFPEFRARPEFGSTSLRDASIPITERVGDRKLTPVSISAGIGFVPQAEKFGRDISGKQYALYTLVRDGDFVYNKGNSLKFPQGCVYQLRGWGEVAAPNVFISFRLKQDFVAEYFQYCFEKNIHGAQLKKHITSGARSNGLLNVSKEQFFGISIPAPLRDEQQKIADCLTSLDEVISAQGRKVEALKTYKRGLMQQLFPREGETLPHLRFPEFRDAPEWEERKIGDICEILNSRRVPISSSDRKAGPYPYYGASGIVDFVDSFIFDERLLLVGEDGAKWGAFEKTAFIVDGKCWVNNHAHVLKCVRVDDRLLESYLTMAGIGAYITGNAPPKLTLGKLKSIPVPIPESEAEQQRIGSCLSAFDALIAAEDEKLDELKTHKKGLMQQLFPTAEEGL